MRTKSAETRRIPSLLVERRVSSGAEKAVLLVALLSGLVGFAFHALWIVTIVALALGLVMWLRGTVVDDRRRSLN
jgi:hypothetical protein